jgi:hypothetical protein
MTPSVSIIIPAYNAVSCLRAAIASCQSQSNRDLELVVIDDGSIDATAELATSIAMTDSRIRLIRHDRNRGLLAARQTGIQAAAADFVMHLDADDLLPPGACDALLGGATRYSADVVQGWMTVRRPDGGSDDACADMERWCNVQEAGPLAREVVNDLLIREMRAHTVCGKLFSRRLALTTVAEFGAEDGLYYLEDLLQMLVVFRGHARYAATRDCTYLYQLGSGIGTSDAMMDEKAFRQRLSVAESLRVLWRLTSPMGDEGLISVRDRVVRTSMQRLFNDICRRAPAGLQADYVSAARERMAAVLPFVHTPPGDADVQHVARPVSASMVLDAGAEISEARTRMASGVTLNTILVCEPGTGVMAGMVSASDLRRLDGIPGSTRLLEVANRNPMVMKQDMTVSAALERFAGKVGRTWAPMVDSAGRLTGLLHLEDLFVQLPPR